MIVSAAILAGGNATRFGGRDKSALDVEGRTILDRQIVELSKVANEILVVGRQVDRPDVRSLLDAVPGRGPLGGLYTALAEAAGDVTLAVACDMPYLSAPLLAYLASLTDDADAAMPLTEHGYHPLCAAYSKRAIEPIARRLATGRLKMRDLVADVRLRTVTVEELERFGEPHRLLANVNTPADYRGLAALHRHQL